MGKTKRNRGLRGFPRIKTATKTPRREEFRFWLDTYKELEVKKQHLPFLNFLLCEQSPIYNIGIATHLCGTYHYVNFSQNLEM